MIFLRVFFVFYTNKHEFYLAISKIIIKFESVVQFGWSKVGLSFFPNRKKLWTRIWTRQLRKVNEDEGELKFEKKSTFLS